MGEAPELPGPMKKTLPDNQTGRKSGSLVSSNGKEIGSLVRAYTAMMEDVAEAEEKEKETEVWVGKRVGYEVVPGTKVKVV